jgi:hypothetical protein
VALGLILLYVAWHHRPSARQPRKQATRMRRLNRINPVTVFPVAIMLQPWVRVGAGGSTVNEANLSGALSALGLVLFG